MSRPQGHRKSQSTSALSFLATHEEQQSYIPPLPSSRPSPSLSNHASSSTSCAPIPSSHTPKDRDRSKYRHRSQLPSVAESTSSASLSTLPGLTTSNERSAKREKSVPHDVSVEVLEEWLSDIRSLRSSTRRRLAGLKGLERYFVEGCMAQRSDMMERIVSLQLHHALLSLLTRHAQTLSHRASHTSIPAGDDLAMGMIPELTIVVGMLQGLCLLSRGCKRAVGEGWAMEMFIDLLLLLRAQAGQGEEKAIAYNIMELLFCVLVDSPETARRFEKLSGLEAVVRVLKGTGATKDVRMKCIEFLYFYLLPEQTDQQRVVSSASSSGSSASSVDSPLYPPSPLSTSQDSNQSVVSRSGRTSPSAFHRDHLADVDMPFVPMTPRKPPQPALGFLTPSSRKVSICNSTSSTPSLPTVPASPRVMPSSSSRGLAAMLDEVDGSSPTIGVEMPTPRSRRSEVGERSGVGLGLGLPKVGGMTRSSTVQRNLSPTDSSSTSPSFTDPFTLAPSSERSHSGSSGSSTVVPSSRNISRSSTQPSLTILQSGPRLPSTTTSRRVSVRRVSKSPLVQSTVPEQGETPEKRKDASATPTTATSGPRTPKIRHSRTQSHLSALAPPPPVPLVPEVLPVPPSAERASRTPSRPHRAFPAELTRGLPPSASSPSLSSIARGGVPTPLGASKRIPSDKRSIPSSARKEKTPMKKDVKSVEEKKEMLGMWLGNVEQLVQGVEKVSFWGSVGNAGKVKK